MVVTRLPVNSSTKGDLWSLISRPLVDLSDPVLARDVLESLRRKLDGGEAAVETMRRKRKVVVHALHYAVERGELGSHPLN